MRSPELTTVLALALTAALSAACAAQSSDEPVDDLSFTLTTVTDTGAEPLLTSELGLDVGDLDAGQLDPGDVDSGDILKTPCSSTLGCAYAACYDSCQTPDRLNMSYCTWLCECIVYDKKDRFTCELENPYIDLLEPPKPPSKELTETSSPSTVAAQDLTPFVSACESQGGVPISTSEQAACCKVCTDKGCHEFCVDPADDSKSEVLSEKSAKVLGSVIAEIESSATDSTARNNDEDERGPGCKFICGKVWDACDVTPIYDHWCFEIAKACVTICMPASGAGTLAP